MTDPWVVNENSNSTDFQGTPAETESTVGFEDNFTASVDRSLNIRPGPLPDSEQYLESLEKKLRRLRRDPNILRQLAEKREECIRNLLNEDLYFDRDGDLILDAPIPGGESAVHEIYRHLRPVQPLNVGETVNIVDYDQLEEQRTQDDSLSESSETASR